MLADVAIHWFIAQALAALAAYLFGRMIGRSSTSMVEIALLLVSALAVGWAVRHAYQDALLHLLPLDLLVYTEGTLIVPAVMLLAGILSVSERVRRRRVLGPLLGTFGGAYLCFNGMWMLAPPVDLHHRSGFQSAPGVFVQTREDTCVAAALATALNAPGIGMNVTESDMAWLADVRVGHGSTLVRALRAARLHTDGLGIDPRLINCSAAEAVSFSSAERPVLVTIRSSPRRHHMVAIKGRTRDGRVLIANPWLDSELGERDEAVPAGLTAIGLEEFSRLYTGAAIVFIPSEAPRFSHGRWRVDAASWRGETADEDGEGMEAAPDEANADEKCDL